MKKVLIVSLTLNCLIILAYAIKRFYYDHRPVAAAPSDWSISWNTQKRDLYSAVPIDSGDIVFVGDSHIERFLLNDFYPGKPVRNRGIGSNTTDQVISRLPSILNRKPSELFLLIGINDLAMHRPVDSVYDNIITLAFMTKTTGVRLHIISLFPSTGNDADLNDEIIALNYRLLEYCKTNGVDYINVHPLLLKDGELNKDLTFDNTHLNSKGYAIFKRQIDWYIDHIPPGHTTGHTGQKIASNIKQPR